MASEAASGAPTGSTAFLDEKEGRLFARMAWLTPRRAAFFLVFWITIFFAGSLLVNNPFVGGPGTTSWDVGAAFSNYYWVVMYLHGLNTGLVGLAALIACDLLELPSLKVRRGILGGALFAGVLSPLGAVFNTSAPWTSVGLWVQVAAFLALDEILVLLLWGMLEVWRAGAPRSRTLPFLTVGLTGGAMLFAALLGHLAGTILGFGNNPSVIGWYASQELGGTVGDFAFNLVEAHSYLMISAVPAGVIALVAIRFGYYGLVGRAKTVARVGFTLVCLDLVFQTVMAVLAGFTTWPGDLPPSVTSLPGVPSFLALNDAVDFAFLVVGGVLVLGAVGAASRRLPGWRHPAGLPLRLLPVFALGMFAILTTVTEPTGDSSVGTPPEAWARLFVAFYLTMLVVLVIVLAERLLGSRAQRRVGWTTVGGGLLTFAGVFLYATTGEHVGGYVAAAGLAVLGLAWLSTAWSGLVERGASSEAVDRPAVSASPVVPARRALFVFATSAALALLLVGAASVYQAGSVGNPVLPGGGGGPTVEYVNSTVSASGPNGTMVFCPGNFTVVENTTVVFTFTIYDTNASVADPSAALVQGSENGTEEVIAYPGASPEFVSSLPTSEVSHTFTIVIGTSVVNVPLPAAISASQPATVVFTMVFGESGVFEWFCNPDCVPYSIQEGTGMAGTVTVTPSS